MSKATLLARAKRELMPDVIYAIVDESGERTGSYGDTADGSGMYWYDSLEQVADDYDIETAPMVEVTEEELEEIRHGN